MRTYDNLKKRLYKKFGEKFFIEDESADKLPHKIPVRCEIEDEKAIISFNKRMKKRVSVSEESYIIRALATKIGIKRLYAHPKVARKAKKIVSDWYDSNRGG